MELRVVSFDDDCQQTFSWITKSNLWALSSEGKVNHGRWRAFEVCLGLLECSQRGLRQRNTSFKKRTISVVPVPLFCVPTPMTAQIPHDLTWLLQLGLTFFYIEHHAIHCSVAKSWRLEMTSSIHRNQNRRKTHGTIVKPRSSCSSFLLMELFLWVPRRWDHGRSTIIIQSFPSFLMRGSALTYLGFVPAHAPQATSENLTTLLCFRIVYTILSQHTTLLVCWDRQVLRLKQWWS